jgi:hypothetical protein
MATQPRPSQPRPLTNAERAVLRPLVAKTTSPKAFFAAARAAGIRRRESDVLRPFRNMVQDSTLERRLIKQGVETKQIARELYDQRARRLGSIRQGAIARPANVPVERVEFPKAKFQYEGYVPLRYNQQQRDQLGKAYADLTKAEKRELEKPENSAARLDAERAIWVSFGSDTPLTKKQVEAKIRDLSTKAGEAYGKTRGAPVLTKYVRSYKKRAKKVKGADEKGA